MENIYFVIHKKKKNLMHSKLQKENKLINKTTNIIHKY